MLMALLPLAGWAAEVDIRGYAINLSSTSTTYTASDITLPTVTLKKTDAADIAAANVNVVWKNAANETVTTAHDAGTYTVTVTAKEGSSVGTLDTPTATFVVGKATLLIKTKNLTPAKVYGFKIADFTDEDKTTNTWSVSETDGEKFLGADNATSTGLTISLDWGTNVNAGTHSVTFTANALTNYFVNFDNATRSWSISKKNLNVTAKNVNLTYGDAFEGGDTNVEFDGFITGEDASNLGGTLSFTTTYEQGSPVSGSPYSWTPAGLTSSNYQISYNAGNIIVAAKDIDKLEIADFDAVTYNKQDQKPDAITASFLGNALEEGAAKDYTLGYYKTATITDGKITAVSENLTAFTDAGTYYVKIDGKGNFGGTTYKEFTIAKKPLAVITKTIDNKTYTGTAQTLATNVVFETYVTFDGLIPASGSITADVWGDKKDTDFGKSDLLNSGKVLTLALTKSGATATAINVDDYTITVSGPADAFKNYAPTYVNTGLYKITAKEIKVTAKDQSKVHGETHLLDAAEGVQTIATPTTDTYYYEKWVTIPTLAGTDAINTYPVVKKSADGKKTVASGLTIKNGDDDVTANYAITYKDGKFTEGKGTINIIANSASYTYGETPAALSATITGLADGELTEAIQAAVDAKVSIVETDHTNAGTYTLTIADAKDAFPAELLANYEETINYFHSTATYEVKKATLTKVTAKQQALKIGDKVDNLVKDATTIEVEGLVNGDEAADVIAEMALKFASFVTVDGSTKAIVTSTVTDATKYKDGTYFKGIEFDETAVLTNYNYPTAAKNKVAGNLVISAADAAIVLARVEKADFSESTINTAAARIAANDGKKVDVTFTFPGQTMYANKWYSMVLPFSTTARAISKAFGYAVVDVLDQSKNEASDVYFKLNMGTVNANEPFIVKVDKDITAAEFEAAATTIKFEGVTIVNSAAPEVADAYGNKFIGTYTGKNGDFDSTKDYVFGFGKDKTTYDPAGATFYVRPLGAWITFKDAQTAGAPTIHIEEIDGSVTAIKAFIVENAAEVKEGWYTLNGVKLNAAPTEKGVYILNGKKFVVK